jgi:uncharacterized protein (TIGR02145 family)
MEDGRIWMIQDLKFGDNCNKAVFAGSSSDQTGSKLTSISGYPYGDCMNATNGSTPANRGYLYDWAAAIQQAGAFYGSTLTVGCSGTGANANACQGICPVGWHIPTGASAGEFYDLHNNYGRNCSTNNDDCWDANSVWKGVLGGGCDNRGSLYDQGSYAAYWSSTYAYGERAYSLVFSRVSTSPGTSTNNKYYGRTVRCVKNY